MAGTKPTRTPTPFPLLGKWNIIESPDFEPDFLNLVQQAHVSFRSRDRGGSILFGAMEADLSWIPERRSDGTTAFRFQGWEEGDQVSGTRTARLTKDGKLEVKLSYEQGDDYTFVAVRAGARTDRMKETRKRIDAETKVPLAISEAERKVLRDETFIDDDIRVQLRARKVEGKLQPVKMTLHDWEDLQGHVAATANHCEDRKLRKALDSVLERIQKQVFDN